ncbi:MAG: hypothetical protein RLZZ63_319 [Gemmatimonadota bacterium]|jgi:hypothetical protein
MLTALRRTQYLVYYVMQLDWKAFMTYTAYASRMTGRSRMGLVLDAVASVYRYNTGLMDYFLFRFFEKEPVARASWVGTGLKYEFDRQMNPATARPILEDKLRFYQAYAPFIHHPHCSRDELIRGEGKADAVWRNPSGKIVIKRATGQCGWDVEVVRTAEWTPTSLVAHMRARGFDLAEAFVQQHPALDALSPAGLNTVRVVTVIDATGRVDHLAARLRLTVNSPVDNLASGNIACPVDLRTGVVCGPGVYSDITRPAVYHHPVTNVPLIGFSVPFWAEILAATQAIARHRPENRGVGWDVAVTERGPDFIEGNHNWCKILWQVPVDRGLKHELERYR